jgi:GNAT superfamily N-acetyltransferase
MATTLRRIRSDDAQLARDLRLRALHTDPLSFGSTYPAESPRDDAFWRQSATRHAESDSCAIFLAFSNSAAVGLVRTAADDSRPGVFFIHSMWVAPEARGAGVAAALLTAAEAWAAAHGATVCELMVTDRAPAARRLYTRCGYSADGYTEPSPHPGVVEHRMQKPVRATRAPQP